ncbi:hypothetical protein Taro_032612, partial [Colocasia esculenta]|nr:hypothetical protein [Colocasia esculenta]
ADHSSQGRPASASGRVLGQKETVESTLAGSQTIIQLDKGNVNTWRQDNDPYTSNAAPPSSVNWHGDQQQMQAYPGANAPTQQFDSWLRAPVQSSPDGMWYRGAPPGGVYRPGGPPGSYPVESYIYYPHLPARPLSNSQAGPRHGPVPGGYGPMNGVPYRPHAPDSYIVPNHPVGPMRPEVYSRQVHYENYYGPGPNVGNGNEQDGPVLGIAPCSSLSNQHVNRNLSVDSENFHAVPCYYAPSVANEQAERGQAHEINGPPYKVLLKQHDGSKKIDSEEKRDQSIVASVARLELGESRPAQKRGSRDEPVVISQHVKGADTHSSAPSVHKDFSISTKSETLDDHCATTARKGEDPPRYSVKRNSTLIEKIESLNNKARFADGRSVVPAFVGEESSRHFMNVNAKAEPTKEANSGALLSDKSSAEKVSFDGDMEIKDVKEAANLESIVDVKGQSKTSEIHTSAIGLLGPSDASLAAQSTHRRVHGKQNIVDYHAKSRLNGQDVEEWRKKSPGRNSSTIDSTENCLVSRVQDSQPCQDASEKKEFHNMKVGDDKYSVSSMDPADYKAQHAKMKEIARQRAKQLQEEEEERIREQKARALAKLEELNRRTLTESSNQTVHPPPSNEAQSGQDPGTCPDLKSDTVASEPSDSNSGSANAVVQKADRVNSVGVPAVLKPSEGVSKLEKSVDSSLQSLPASVVHNDPSTLQKHGGIRKEGNTDLQFHDNSVSKQKLMSQKRQDNRPEEKHMFENVSIGVMVGSIIVGSKGLGESAPPSNSTGDGVHSISKNVDGPSLQHKKRNNRITKNKNKLDETPSAILPSKIVVEDVKTEVCKPKPSESEVEDDAPVLPEASNKIVGVEESSDVATMSANQGLAEGTEVPGKATVQWRAQPPKRITRNLQSKSVDKFHGTEGAVWAPVKSTNRKELSEEVQKVTDKSNLESSGKNGNDIEHNLRSKRAEMERYVPKPIAKELTQQETSQQPPSSCVHLAASGSKAELGSEGTTGGELDHAATVKIEVPANTKNGENSRPNRHGRAHASWRRRGPPESSSPLPSLLEGSSSSDSNKDTRKASCLQQPSEHDNSQKEQPKISDDGWNDDNNYVMQCEPVNTFSLDKDHTKMNRGRRQPYKGHKVIGSTSGSRDNWEPGHGKTDKAMSQMTMEPDESAVRKTVRSESQSASSHLRSQWQPKSQVSSTPNHCQGTTETGVQRVASQGDRYGKDSLLPLVGNHDRPVENKNVSTAITFPAEGRNPRHHEAKRERRVQEELFIRQNRTPNQESRIVPELVPQNAVSQNEPISSGGRHHGQHGGWLARSHEVSFGGDSGQDQGPDAGKHNQPANIDRRKQYQRAGSYGKQNDDSFKHSSAVGEAAQNVSKPMGKYRERGHNHPRRGSHVYSQNRNSDAHGNGD